MAASLLLACLATACQEPAEPPDHVSEYIEFYSENDEPLCGGTARYADAYIESVFELIGEPVPDGPFVEYRWNREEWGMVAGYAVKTAEGARVEAGMQIHEHELVHAAVVQVWPRAPSFLEEGLAVMLSEGVSVGLGVTQWPSGPDLDRLLEDDSVSYAVAWMVVSQLVLEQGMTGLREFWFAVERGMPTNEIRRIYSEMFGGELDELLQPFETDYFGDPETIPRRPCTITFCLGEPVEAERGEVALLQPPDGCSDSRAVGPTFTSYSQWSWSEYMFPSGYPAPVRPLEGYDYRAVPCGGLECSVYTSANVGESFPPDEPWRRITGRQRVRVGIDPSVFPEGGAPPLPFVAE